MVNISYWKQVQFEELIPSKGKKMLPVQPHTQDRVICLQTPPYMRFTKFCELGGGGDRLRSSHPKLRLKLLSLGVDPEAYYQRTA